MSHQISCPQSNQVTFSQDGHQVVVAVRTETVVVETDNFYVGQPAEGQGGSYSPLILVVTTNGQTVWNLGMTEPRRTLHIGGIYLTLNVHYTLVLPYLTLTQNLGLVAGQDTLVLT